MSKRQKRKWTTDSDSASEEIRLAWLANLYYRLLPNHPKLTLEKFAANHDIELDVLKPFVDRIADMPEEDRATSTGRRVVYLWHGTTEDCAARIVEEGFHTGSLIWMTRNERYAKQIAVSRAGQRGFSPALFCSCIDLKVHRQFTRMGAHYIFQTDIPKSVICDIYHFVEEIPEEVVEATIGKTSSRDDVHCWMNQCLQLLCEKRIGINHPTVDALYRWCQTQYANGRKSDLTDNEMLVVLSELSVKHAVKRLGVGARTIYRWISEGRLKAKSLCEHVLVSFHADDAGKTFSGQTATLFYGTTEKQAKKIIKEGFQVRHAPPKETWFSRQVKAARNLAITNASQRRDTPVVITCEIPLDTYPDFEAGRKNYIFHCSIGKEVIRDVLPVGNAQVSMKKENKSENSESLDVVVTKAAGAMGVRLWLNAYFASKGEPPIGEDDPIVEEVHRWVATQYNDGRIEPVTDEELIEQVTQNPMRRRG